MTQTLQFMPIIRREKTSMETISTMSHVSETGINVTTQPHDSELQATLPSSSQMDDLANTSVVLSSDRTLILAEAVSKYVEWKINPPATLTMILIEHDEMNAQTWRIWYVLRSDQEKTMTICRTSSLVS